MNKRILVVEDDGDLRDILNDVLSGAGYEPCFAATGEDGLEMAHSMHPDLVILDLMLPGIDGISVCRELTLHDNTRDIPVLALTARRELPVKISTFMAGAKRYVTKPFDIDILLKEIKRFLGGNEDIEAASTPVSPSFKD